MKEGAPLSGLPRPVIALLSIAAFVFAVASFLFASFTAEDAYITARHAANFVTEGALVFNANERVFALTSPLHGLIEAALRAVSGSIIVPNKILSVLALAAATWIALRTRPRTPLKALLWAALVVASPCVILWTWGGLETPYLLLLATAIAASSIAPGPWTLRRLAALHALAGLAFLTRYDSVLFTAPIVLHSWWQVRRVRPILASVIVGAAVPIAWIVAAQAFYGIVLPTSAYVKRPEFTRVRMLANASYVGAWLAASGTIPLAIAALVAARAARSAKTEARHPRGLRARDTLGVEIGLVAMLLFSLGVATHHMMFAFRFFVPYLGPAALVVAQLASSARGDRNERGAAVPRGVVIVTAAVLLFHISNAIVIHRASLNGIVPLGEYRRVGARVYSAQFVPALLQGGRDLERHWASTRFAAFRRPSVATFAGGALPFECESAYVYEQLASYRHNWAVAIGLVTLYGARRPGPDGMIPKPRALDARRCADYVHVMVPRHGSLAMQLGAPPERFQIVSRVELMFEGSAETILVLWNPDPQPGALPRTVSGDIR